MLAIRLQRIGKKNRPSYRVVLSEKKRDLYGNHNEILGNYDPVSNPKTINLKADRIKHWISLGAQPSATVHNLLVTQGVIEGKKVKAWAPKKKKEENEKKPDQVAQAEKPADKIQEQPKTEEIKQPTTEATEKKSENTPEKTE